MRVRATALAVGWAVGTPVALAAQGGASLSTGLASMRYADSVSLMAATVGPTLRYESDYLSLLAAGAYSHLRYGSAAESWTSQGAFAGSAFTPAAGVLRGEIGGRAGLSAHQDGTRTGQWMATGRGHVMIADRGLWGGAGGGRTWDGGAWRELRALDVGAWMSRGPAMLVATAAPTSVSVASGSPVRYTDVELSARWTAARLELGGLLGTRAGGVSVTPGEERVWGGATATVRLVGPLAIVGSAGTYPVDYAQSFPGGRYLSLALEVASPRASSRLVDARRVAAGARRDVDEFAVTALPSGGRRLRVRAPSASRVEVAGSFSDWQPRTLRRAASGWWEADLTVRPGTHEVALRVDGGAWGAPPGLIEISDELGGRSGLLVVR